MKKSTLIFFAALAAVFLSASDSQAIYATLNECQADCKSPWSCRIPSGGTAYICSVQDSYYCVASGVKATTVYKTLADCRYTVSTYTAFPIVRECYKDQNGWYRFQAKTSSCSGAEAYQGPEPVVCPSNCSSCSSSSVCTTCDSGYYLSSGSCISCPSNATCSGTSVFTCNSGYTKLNGACVKDTPSNTVNSCPSRMKLSDDGCCCINK